MTPLLEPRPSLSSLPIMAALLQYHLVQLYTFLSSCFSYVLLLAANPNLIMYVLQF
eukprot:c49378_g1_i1 orf=131-298(-)